jgi:hypothetical protein
MCSFSRCWQWLSQDLKDWSSDKTRCCHKSQHKSTACRDQIKCQSIRASQLLLHLPYQHTQRHTVTHKLTHNRPRASSATCTMSLMYKVPSQCSTWSIWAWILHSSLIHFSLAWLSHRSVTWGALPKKSSGVDVQSNSKSMSWGSTLAITRAFFEASTERLVTVSPSALLRRKPLSSLSLHCQKRPTDWRHSCQQAWLSASTSLELWPPDWRQRILYSNRGQLSCSCFHPASFSVILTKIE